MIVITSVKQADGMSSTGTVVHQIVVTFTVNGHGPFTQTFDKASFEPAAVQQALQAFAQKIAQVQSLGDSLLGDAGKPPVRY